MNLSINIRLLLMIFHIKNSIFLKLEINRLTNLPLFLEFQEFSIVNMK